MRVLRRVDETRVKRWESDPRVRSRRNGSILGIAGAYWSHRIYDSYKPVTLSLEAHARGAFRCFGPFGSELSG